MLKRKGQNMKFDMDLLLEYKELLQKTNLRECYQEFIKLFRYIRVSLEKSMPEYKFQGNIVENGMDYSYFSFTNHQLKEKGLKIAVIFVHRDFQFEVWLSGFSRKYQSKYYDLLKERNIPFELTDNPAQKDYILRTTLDGTVDLSDGSLLIKEIRNILDELLMFAETL